MPVVDLSDIQKRIREAMASRGITEKRLSRAIRARHAGSSMTLVRDILSGKSANPRLQSLERIAVELGTPVETLIGGGLSPPQDLPRLPIPSSDALAGVIEAIFETVAPDRIPSTATLSVLADALHETLVLFALDPEAAADGQASRSLARVAARQVAHQSRGQGLQEKPI